VKLGAQSPFSTFALVTVVGGGANDLPALIIEKICSPLIPAMTAKTAMRPRITLKIGHF
jgi:hypothetical protein